MYFMIGQICQGRNVLIKRYEKYMYSAITDDKDSILGVRLVTRKQEAAAEAGVTDRSTVTPPWMVSITGYSQHYVNLP